MRSVVRRLSRALLSPCSPVGSVGTSINNVTLSNFNNVVSKRTFTNSIITCHTNTKHKGKKGEYDTYKPSGGKERGSAGSSSSPKPSKPASTHNSTTTAAKKKPEESPNIDKQEITRLATEFTSIFDLYRYGVSQFTQADLSYGHSTLTPWEDASFLILHELHLPYNDPITHWSSATLTQQEREHLLTMIQLRVKTKKPVAYLVQGCYQQGEYFYIDERALIPRSFIGDLLRDKELLRIHKPTHTTSIHSKQKHQAMQQALELDYNDYISEIVDEDKFLQSQLPTTGTKKKTTVANVEEEEYLFQHDKVQSVLDLCTGSGCLAVLAAKYFPQVTHIDAVDIAEDTLEVAQINVEMKDLEELIHLHHGDLYEALPKFYSGEVDLDDTNSLSANKKRELHAFQQTYDLIISNPPYVTSEDMDYLPQEYLHEPALALEAGHDGLSVVSSILQHAHTYLNDGGGLLCEVGQCKPALEQKYKELFGQAHKHRRVQWIATDNSKDEVFYIRKEFLHPKYLK